jgi:hypothetical protein
MPLLLLWGKFTPGANGSSLGDSFVRVDVNLPQRQTEQKYRLRRSLVTLLSLWGKFTPRENGSSLGDTGWLSCILAGVLDCFVGVDVNLPQRQTEQQYRLRRSLVPLLLMWGKFTPRENGSSLRDCFVRVDVNLPQRHSRSTGSAALVCLFCRCGVNLHQGHVATLYTQFYYKWNRTA